MFEEIRHQEEPQERDYIHYMFSWGGHNMLMGIDYTVLVTHQLVALFQFLDVNSPLCMNKRAYLLFKSNFAFPPFCVFICRKKKSGEYSSPRRT